MVETYRTGSTQGDSGATSQFYRPGLERGAVYPERDVEASGTERWPDYGRRGRRRSGLFLEDSIVLLGILLGGAAGYAAAATVRSADVSRRSPRTSFGKNVADRYSAFMHGTRPSGATEKDETTDLIASSKVEGTAVYDRHGEKLGEVYNFMVGKRSGRVAYAVMSFGGFLGIGQKYHPLPWSALTYDTDKKGYVVDADRDRLMGAPSYQAGEEPFAQPGYAEYVRDYWSSEIL